MFRIVGPHTSLTFVNVFVLFFLSVFRLSWGLFCVPRSLVTFEACICRLSPPCKKTKERFKWEITIIIGISMPIVLFYTRASGYLWDLDMFFIYSSRETTTIYFCSIFVRRMALALWFSPYGSHVMFIVLYFGKKVVCVCILKITLYIIKSYRCPYLNSECWK